MKRWHELEDLLLKFLKYKKFSPRKMKERGFFRQRVLTFKGEIVELPERSQRALKDRIRSLCRPDPQRVQIAKAARTLSGESLVELESYLKTHQDEVARVVAEKFGVSIAVVHRVRKNLNIPLDRSRARRSRSNLWQEDNNPRTQAEMFARGWDTRRKRMVQALLEAASEQREASPERELVPCASADCFNKFPRTSEFFPITNRRDGKQYLGKTCKICFWMRKWAKEGKLPN